MVSKEDALKYHNQTEPGKIEIISSKPMRGKKDLGLAYTPGVAYPCLEIKENKDKAWDYTFKGNTIAVLTDGSRVLGLGDIGPLAGLPVMEGKGLLFKLLGDVNAIPICLKTNNAKEIIETMQRLEPTFGGVNIEDIKPPRCFEVLEGLRGTLEIPVFHDDQHGTAVVVFAGLINALKVVEKQLQDVKITINGAGSAGLGIAKLLAHAGAKEIVVVDSKGAIYEGRDLDVHKEEVAKITNRSKKKGDLKSVIKGSDVFIGASVPNILTKEMVRSMDRPIVFALANPVPEIDPKDAKAAGAAVVGTGSSEWPNQVNNVLGFPGIFRGMLDCRATAVNREMRVAAAHAIASLVKRPTAEKILPEALDPKVAPAVARAVVEAAERTGVARKKIDLKEYEKIVAKRIKRHSTIVG